MRRNIRLSGEQTKALLVAVEFFRGIPDIPPQKKELANYSAVEVREEAREYAVTFEPKTHPRDRTVRGGETSFGVEITLFVDKATWQVVRTQRYM